MNGNTGQLYDTYADAIADLKPHEKPEDVVEIFGTRETVEKLARSVQQAKEIEARRAANKRARAARKRNRA